MFKIHLTSELFFFSLKGKEANIINITITIICCNLSDFRNVDSFLLADNFSGWYLTTYKIY